MTGILLSAFVLALILAIVIILHTLPDFGAGQKKEDVKRYAQLSHHNGQKFENRGKVDVKMKASDMIRLMPRFIKGTTGQKPAFTLPQEKPKIIADVTHHAEQATLTWLGHSALLLQIQGKTILIDPMLGPRPSPLPFLGSKRFNGTSP